MAPPKAKTLLSGDGRTITISDILDNHKDKVSMALPYCGDIDKLNKHTFSLTIGFKTTDCDNLEHAKTCKVYTLERQVSHEVYIQNVISSSRPLTATDIACVRGDNGRYMAKLRNEVKLGCERQVLEIWDTEKLLKAIHINELEDHCDITVNPTFASMWWCPFGEQDKLLYVTRPRRNKSYGFFGQQVRPDEGPIRDNDNFFVDSWGEGFKDGLDHTILAVMDASSGCGIKTFNYPDHTLADSRWIDGGRKIISVAYDEKPRRLGIIYCNNKPSKLVIHNLGDGSTCDIKEDGFSLHTIRANHKGDKVLYLKNPSYGPHKHYTSMHLLDVETKESKKILDECYCTIPRNCFSSNDESIIFVSYNEFYAHLTYVHLETGEHTKIQFPTVGVEILDYRHDILLTIGSNITSTPTTYVAQINNPKLVHWHQIDVCTHLEDVSYEVAKIETSDKTDHITAMLVSPNLRPFYKIRNLPDTGARHRDLPTIVVPHGGPHSAFEVKYYQQIVILAHLGFRTILVNYRGSMGAGKDHVRKLCGNVGTMDVEDCLQAIRYFVKHRKVDPNKLILRSGSHGGFLCAHLQCNNEFPWTSAILRNPVIDLSNMYAISDIPEWVFTEALKHDHYDAAYVPTKEELAKMLEVSPVTKFKDTNVPTLIQLGSEDRRVPMSQGLQWYHLLKARGVKTECKVYADKHDLLKPATETDSVISAAIWMLENLQPTST